MKIRSKLIKPKGRRKRSDGTPKNAGNLDWGIELRRNEYSNPSSPILTRPSRPKKSSPTPTAQDLRSLTSQLLIQMEEFLRSKSTERLTIHRFVMMKNAISSLELLESALSASPTAKSLPKRNPSKAK